MHSVFWVSTPTLLGFFGFTLLAPAKKVASHFIFFVSIFDATEFFYFDF
jgi:hypothetical protein